jgi:hypothetical protein
MSLYVPYYRPYNKHNTNIHAHGGIRTHDASKRAAEDPLLRPHGHWDRRIRCIKLKIVGCLCWFLGPLCIGNCLFTCGRLRQYSTTMHGMNSINFNYMYSNPLRLQRSISLCLTFKTPYFAHTVYRCVSYRS